MSLLPSNYNVPNKPVFILTFLFSLLWNTSVMAFGANDNTPIKIQSDRAELNNQKGIATYTGDVIVTQGEATLNAEKVIIYSTNNTLVKIEAFGNPAHFSQEKNADTPKTDAYGETIIYNEQSQILKLIKKARLQQASNSFSGDVIEYNTLKGIVNAHGSPTDSTTQSNSRVEIEFHPNQVSPTPNNEKNSENE